MRPTLPRAALLAVGWLSVALGLIGILVPGMPTTTFLLIAAWCFYRSSDRAHAWLMAHRVLGPYVRDFVSGAGMPRRAKVVAITSVWVTCGSSALFFVQPMWGKLVVVLCGLIATVAIVRVKTRPAHAC